MSEHTPTPWMWAWRNDEKAPASIISMPRVGHAYAVAMCPRYQKPEQWMADAKLIVKAVNNHARLTAENERLRKALEEIAAWSKASASKEAGMLDTLWEINDRAASEL